MIESEEKESFPKRTEDKNNSYEFTPPPFSLFSCLAWASRRLALGLLIQTPFSHLTPFGPPRKQISPASSDIFMRCHNVRVNIGSGAPVLSHHRGGKDHLFMWDSSRVNPSFISSSIIRSFP